MEVDELLQIVRDEVSLVGMASGLSQKPLLEVRERAYPAVDLDGHAVADGGQVDEPPSPSPSVQIEGAGHHEDDPSEVQEESQLRTEGVQDLHRNEISRPSGCSQ